MAPMSNRALHPVSVGVLLIGAFWASPASAANDAVILCGGLPATIVGTPNDDLLSGTNGPDVIVGLGGADVIRGGAGDDVMCGGKGADSIRGDGGDDVLLGEQNEGTSWGGEEGDRLDGGPGDDVVDGGRGGRRSLDQLTYREAGAPVVVNANRGVARGRSSGKDQIANVGYVLGSSFDDRVVGVRIVFAGPGDDVIRGTERGFGETGDDQIFRDAWPARPGSVARRTGKRRDPQSRWEPRLPVRRRWRRSAGRVR